MTIIQRKLRQYGVSAFARHCANLDIPFDDCYYAIFGRYPKR